MQTITIKAFEDLNDPVLIDVREQNEWGAGHIKNAEFLPLSKIIKGIAPGHDLKTPIILYCQAGVRSAQAIEILKLKGYENLTNLEGGYAAWLASKA